jgi:uncharacterized membrane protein YkvA (DUF1232 family)
VNSAASNSPEGPPEPNDAEEIPHYVGEFDGVPEDLSKDQADVYQAVRQRMRGFLSKLGPGFKYADILLVAPDMFHVLCRLVADRRIPPLQKAKLAATLAYFVTPIGIVPEALVGPIGYIDDVALTAYVLNGVLNSEQAHIVREHWAGDEDILSVVQNVLEVADSAIGAGLWQRVKGLHLLRKFRP